MSEMCKDCRYWTPGVEANYAEKVAEMGYGDCELITGADLDGPSYPFALTELDNVGFITHASFGCNQHFHKEGVK